MSAMKPKTPTINTARLWLIPEHGVPRVVATARNARIVTWGFIVAQLLRRQQNYVVNTLYVEYENVANPNDPVTIPSFAATDGLEYYQNLRSSASKDFLRVPLRQDPHLGIISGYESYFTEGVSGNRLTYFGMTSGVEGFHGKPFADTSNSKIYGVALVAAPVVGDASQDVLFARAYYAAGQQQVKSASGQIAVTWDIGFPTEGVA